jgi:hypothetical protein
MEKIFLPRKQSFAIRQPGTVSHVCIRRWTPRLLLLQTHDRIATRRALSIVSALDSRFISTGNPHRIG